MHVALVHSVPAVKMVMLIALVLSEPVSGTLVLNVLVIGLNGQSLLPLS